MAYYFEMPPNRLGNQGTFEYSPWRTGVVGSETNAKPSIDRSLEFTQERHFTCTL